MFDAQDHARLFSVGLGIDFPKALVDGLRDRMDGKPPDAMARVHLIVNTTRMRRRITRLFADGPSCLMPRISLLGEIGADPRFHAIPPAEPSLAARMALIPLVHGLLKSDPRLAMRRSLFDLSDTLAALLDEMQGEGVEVSDITSLDVRDESDHWARAQQFIGIVQGFLDRMKEAPDAEGRQRMVVDALIDGWQTSPPDHPVILAGSTGSRGTTLKLMKAIARLPQGAVVLPGFDTDMPETVWDTLSQEISGGLSPEDHPQYRFAALMKDLDLRAADVPNWHDTPAADPARNKTISLALRPVPVTDSWLREGPELGPLQDAMRGVTLLQTQTQREEALVIAMRLRQAAENGETAALITPDRVLSRQVTAALDRWNITPDDSAGTPLQLSPPGRFLRHVGDLLTTRLTAETLLIVLKHPLAHSGEGRNTHLRLTRNLELSLRDNGPAFPDGEMLRAWASAVDAPEWGDWLALCFGTPPLDGTYDAEELAEQHQTLAELIAKGSVDTQGSGGLWDKAAGRQARSTIDDFHDNLDGLPQISTRDYVDLFSGVLSRGEVRDRDEGHPNVLIWGTLEARVQGADLLILAGLNEGGWPEAPSPDPWLNRRMRAQAGLLLPERRIGLSAHDFQQAACGPEVWLTRAERSDDAETVPSRWLNRLTNLLGGLEGNGGKEALEDMTARGDLWREKARVLETPLPAPRAKRPSPRPPVSARPRRLSVTRIKTLVRDPYAIYAQYVLGLEPLESFVKTADARLRGIAAHSVFENFIKARDKELDPDRLVGVAREVFEETVDWPSARLLWEARIARIAAQFVTDETERQKIATPQHFEKKGKVEIASLGFTLSGIADRIDMDERGGAVVYDYKTGAIPTENQQIAYDMQLLLLCAMAMRGGFEHVSPRHISGAQFLGIGSSAKNVDAPLNKITEDAAWAALTELLTKYLSVEQGFTARRAMEKSSDQTPYDQLSRFGEWDDTDPSDPGGVQ